MNSPKKDTPPVIRPLSRNLRDIAERELNEVPHRVAEDVLMLRHWIGRQPHLRARTDDQFLVAFLRGSKFSLEKAKRKIERYYTLRAAIPEVFNERRQVDDPTVLEIIRLGIILQIPMPAEDSRPCVTIIRATAYDTEKYKFADVVRVGSMIGEIMMMEDDNATVSGYVEIMDMCNVTAAHFLQLRPNLLRKFSIFADEAMPLRQRGTCFINIPLAFEKGFNSLRSLLPDKMGSRIRLSSSPEAIFDYAPREYLPIEYGGTRGTIQDIVERMEAKLLSYRDHFREELSYGPNERYSVSGEPEFNYESYFGVEGSFRKLDID